MYVRSNMTLVLREFVRAVRAARIAEDAARECWVSAPPYYGCKDPERYKWLKGFAAAWWHLAWIYAAARFQIEERSN